jgi:hypothetical protein
MHSTLNPKTDPQRVLVARVDEELAHTYEQIAQADEQIARAEEQLSKLEQDAARYPSDHPQTRTNTLRPAVLGNRPSPGGGRYAASSACCWQRASVSLLSYRSRLTAMRPGRLSRGGRRSWS